ncbi:aldehyde reductase, partial [Catenulispora sp. NL8]
MTVLVTGGSGFVGVHCILRLLQTGHSVRTTVRSPAREEAVRAMLRTSGVEAGDALSFAYADLTADAGWADAAKDCEHVLHVASPFPWGVPEHEDELIVPARDGTLRVLRAAGEAGVRRVVLTSSFAAISYGHADRGKTLSEQDWTELDGPHVGAYAKSKTLAERAAWEFVKRRGGSPELTVINPGGVLGPALGSELPTSLILIQRLLDRDLPALPRLSYSVVDVRDLAELHLRAMTDPAAAGERFLAVAGPPMWIADIARVVHDQLGAAGRRVPTRVLPDALVRMAALFDKSLRPFLPELGKVKKADGSKAGRVLGWETRSTEETIVASAESLISLGLVKAASI